MPDQIATITIPCLVIALNTTQFFDVDGYGSIGKVLQVPCRNVLYDNTEAWAVPQSDGGIFTGFTFHNKAGDDLAQPTVDSFTVCRITDKLSGNWWRIYGTYSNFLQSCATCCGDSPVSMPLTASEKIAPCFEVGDPFSYAVNANGKFIQTIGVQDPIVAGKQYFPFGNYNNNSFPSADPAGYPSVAALLVYLNATWNTISSPAVTIAWTSAPGVVIATMTSGAAGGDSFCMNVVLV